MISLVSRGGASGSNGSLSTVLKATSTAIQSFNQAIDHDRTAVKTDHSASFPLDPVSSAKILSPGVKRGAQPTVTSLYDELQTVTCRPKSLAVGSFGQMTLFNVATGLIVPVGQGRRHAHTDIRVPDFSDYRRDGTKDPKGRNSSTVDERRSFTYLMTGVALSSAVVGAKGTVGSLVSVWSASKDVLALAKIEVDLNSIPAGKNVVLKWRFVSFLNELTNQHEPTETTDKCLVDQQGKAVVHQTPDARRDPEGVLR